MLPGQNILQDFAITWFHPGADFFPPCNSLWGVTHLKKNNTCQFAAFFPYFLFFLSAQRAFAHLSFCHVFQLFLTPLISSSLTPSGWGLQGEGGSKPARKWASCTQFFYKTVPSSQPEPGFPPHHKGQALASSLLFLIKPLANHPNQNTDIKGPSLKHFLT